MKFCTRLFLCQGWDVGTRVWSSEVGVWRLGVWGLGFGVEVWGLGLRFGVWG